MTVGGAIILSFFFFFIVGVIIGYILSSEQPPTRAEIREKQLYIEALKRLKDRESLSPRNIKDIGGENN